MIPHPPASIKGLVTLIVILALLPALSLIVFSGHDRFRTGVENVDQAALRASATLARRHAGLVENSRSLLRTLSHLEEVRGQDARAATVLFQNLLLHAPDYANIRLCDPEGYTIASGNKESAALSPLERVHFLSIKAAPAFTVYALPRGRGYDFPILNCQLPIFEDGVIRSVLVASVIMTVRPDEAEHLKATHVEAVHIVDEQGKIIFAHPSLACEGLEAGSHLGDSWKRVSSTPAVSGVFRNSAGEHTVFERLPSHEPDKPDLVVLLTVSMEPIYVQMREQIVRYLILLVSALAVALLVTRFLCAVGLLRPLRLILDAATRIKEGNLATRIGDAPMADELRQLADSLDIMSHSLEGRDKELLAARDVATAANQAKTDFLANMSHEIRTPMNAISGMTYLALQEELTEQQRGYLESIREETAKLKGLVNDILDFSKMQTGSVHVEAVTFDLRSILQELVKHAEEDARGNHIAFRHSLAPDLPQFLSGDPVHLSQAMSSIIHNAIRVTPEGGVAFSCMAERSSPNSLVLVCRVEDTAGGMDERELNEYFPKNEKPDRVADLEGSVGLSLAVARNLVHLMKGVISVETKPGTGSTVTLRLPFVELAAPAAQRP